MPNAKTGRKITVFTLVILVVAALVVTAILKNHEAVITVQTEPVTRRNLTEIVVANGRIQPVVQVKISAEVSGEIIELAVKEGQSVKRGDLLVRIKPDVYQAQQRSSEAAYQSSLSSLKLAQANLAKAELEAQRNEDLFHSQLISDSTFLEFKTALEIAQAQVESAQHQADVAKASLARAEEELAKTTIDSPITGTVSKLNLEVGERVAGNTMMAGTEIMTVADLNDMEARVDIGETDIVLLRPGQKAQLEVDAFKDRRFWGQVSEIANSSKTSALGNTSQEATKFEVKIRIHDKEAFRPGMSVTAYVETRYRTNVLTVPIASVAARLPKESANKINAPAHDANGPDGHESATNRTNSNPDVAKAGRKAKDPPKPISVVFVREGDHVKMAPVKIGISDEDHWEITEGLTEGMEIVSGGYKAINRELEDGKKIRIGKPDSEGDQEKP